MIEPLPMGKTIKSWAELQNEVQNILKALKKDHNLTIAAASNPLMALEELGYEIDLDIVGHLEDKLRFKTRQVAQLSKLRKSVHDKAGKKFNIRSEHELNSVLFDDLEIEAYDEKGCPIRKTISKRRKGDDKDDLDFYVDLHPVVKPLLAFRKLDASIAGFCDSRTYRKIRTGGYGKKSNIIIRPRLKKK